MESRITTVLLPHHVIADTLTPRPHGDSDSFVMLDRSSGGGQSSGRSSASTCTDEHFRECFKFLNEFRVEKRYYPPSNAFDQWRSNNDCYNDQDDGDKGFLCDVEIRVADYGFFCHRVLLAAGIPYFRSMFSSAMLETTQRRIEIKDISPHAFEQLLNYVYTGKITVSIESAQSLLYAASILQMDRVSSVCEKFLSNYLTIQNCLSIRNIAQAHNRRELLHEVDAFTLDRFAELRQSDEFLRIGEDHLIHLISSSDLNVKSEIDAYQAVIDWVGFDKNNRIQFLPDMLSRLRLCQLPTQFFFEKVVSNPLLKENEECQSVVSKASQQHLMVAGVYSSSSSSAIDDEMSRPRKSVAGVIFCIGGRGTNGDPFRSVEAYDARRNRWTAVAELSTKRRHVGVISAFGKLYAIGGHDGVSHLGSVEVYDPATNSWSSVESMHTRRRGIAVGRLENAIYAVGGLDDNTCFDSVERYDIEANRWQEVAHTNFQRGGVGVAALGKFLYAIGGNDGMCSLDSCERYDPLLNKWTLMQSMAHRRAGAGVTVLNGYLYAIGGFDDNAPLSTCERYNPQTNTWESLPPMSRPRGGVGAAALGGRMYAVGGHDGINYLNSVEAYDPAKNSWESVAPIMQCRAGAGVAWCDCSVDDIQSTPVL